MDTQKSKLSQLNNGFMPGIVTGAVLTAAMAGSYALGAGGAATAQDVEPVVTTSATRNAAAMQDAFADVAKAAGPAVVTITTRREAPAGQTRPGQTTPGGRRRGQGGGLGSGMIYRSDGLILTNAHVVRGATNVQVRLQNEREYPARVLGSDPATDVAVLKIDGTNLPTVKLGDSAPVRAGDWAIAVGNPFGLANTLTVGVISATAREVPLSRRGLTDYLQTDASINPGNSGGPLLDIYGRVIGINNAIFSESGGNEGIGFAIPINTARDIAARLVSDGRISRGVLGVTISDARERAEELGLNRNVSGAVVETVAPGSAGAQAGLRKGDIVQQFNGQPITRSSELQRLVGNTPVGRTAELQVLRDGRPITLTVRLSESNDQQ